MVDGVFNTFSIMEASIVREKRRLRPPTIYVEPDIEGVRILEFHKANQVFAQAEPARDQLRRELERALAG